MPTRATERPKTLAAGRLFPSSAGKQATHEDSEDGSYLPLSEDEVILGTDDFIVLEEPIEEERFNAS